jgi:cytochrome oxidase assembly protein ShyY1
VRVDGRFDNAKELYLYSVADERVGWHVITPLTSSDGAVLMVDRGFVPDVLRDPAKRAQGEIEGPVTVTGLARTPEIQGAFVPDNEVAANRWFWRDLAGMTEEGFLNPLRELVDRGYTRAEELLRRYHGEWNGDLSPLFREYNFL